MVSPEDTPPNQPSESAPTRFQTHRDGLKPRGSPSETLSDTFSLSTLSDNEPQPSPENVHGCYEETHPPTTNKTADEPQPNHQRPGESDNDHAEPSPSLRRRNTDGPSASEPTHGQPQSGTQIKTWRIRNPFYLSGRMAANIGWIMAGMGVAITGLSLYPSFEALDHDRWEALKEYREYCVSISQAERSARCQKYANMDLPEPPKSTYIQRRSQDADRLVGQWSVRLTHMELKNRYCLLALFVIVLLAILVLVSSVGKAPVNGKGRKDSAQPLRKRYPAKFAQGQKAWLRGSRNDSARKVTVVKMKQDSASGKWCYMVGEAKNGAGKKKGAGSELRMMSNGEGKGPDWVPEVLLQRSRPRGSTVSQQQ